MSIFVFANNASSLLASSMTNVQTTAVVTAGQGALFPAIGAGQIAACTIEDVSGNIEVVYATGRTGDTLTIVRGEEGTTALAFAAGSRIEQRVTLGVLAALLQKTGGDTLSGSTALTGVLNLGGGGSIQNGEIAGAALRGAPGVTSNQILIPAGGSGATAGASLILTASNVAGNLPAGVDFVRTGMVIGWTGLSSAIPAGWHLCDGTGGTINLLDQFIVGGGGALPVTGTYSSTTGATSAGTPTLNAVTLLAANMPSHHHGNTIYAGNAGQVVGPTGTPAGGAFFFGGTGAGVAINWNTADNVGGSTPFTPTANALGTHTHSVSAPPYTAMFMIQKL
jgi:hypothetical protein